MAINRTPFFKSFQNAHRMGNVAQNRPRVDHIKLPQRVSSNNELEGSLAHYTLPPATHNMARQAAKMQQATPKPPMIPMQQQMPTLQQGMQQPMQQTEPLPPENAAERFQQANRALPDGVRFEPLDEETKAALKKLGMSPPEPPKSVPAPPEPAPAPTLAQAPQMPLASPTAHPPQIAPPVPRPGPIPPQKQPEPPITIAQETPESAELLKRLIQDDRNASVYYQYLSEIAPTDSAKETLQSIAKDNEKRCQKYQHILQGLHNMSFEPQSTDINTTVGFNTGVQIAVSEEGKILEAMAELIDNLADKGSANIMQNLLNRRMIRLNWLQWTMYQATG